MEIRRLRAGEICDNKGPPFPASSIKSSKGYDQVLFKISHIYLDFKTNKFKDGKMQYSFESPLCLLENSFVYNDYEFVLYHLINKYPQYKEFVKQSKAKNRFMIMDNSAYELRHSYNLDEFAKCIEEYKPDFYILPDAFNDAKITMERSLEFLIKYPNLPSKPMGTIHGSTVEEMDKCYEFMKEHTDAIAISFRLDIFKQLANSEVELCDARSKYDFDVKKTIMIWPDDMAYALGREKYIKHLEQAYLLDYDKYYHLLGVNLPQELIMYKHRPYFKSIDTSNPIISGMNGVRYSKVGDGEKLGPITYQSKSKPKEKMNDLMGTQIDFDKLAIIKYNIEGFKANYL